MYVFQIYQKEFWEADAEDAIGPAGNRIIVFAVAVLIVALGVWPEHCWTLASARPPHSRGAAEVIAVLLSVLLLTVTYALVLASFHPGIWRSEPSSRPQS